jgi:acyl-coenzyme A synthetase/AMP-(fatty) acid ligase
MIFIEDKTYDDLFNESSRLDPHGKIIIRNYSFNNIALLLASIRNNCLVCFNDIDGKYEKGFVFQTSGTTGKPKEVNLPFSRFIYNDKISPKTVLLFYDINHIAGIDTLMKAISTRSKVVIVDNKNPKYVSDIIKKNNIDVLPCTPTFLKLLLMSGSKLESVKYIVYGGESLDSNVRNMLGNKKIIQTYGLTEIGVINTYSDGELLIINENYEIKNNVLWINGINTNDIVEEHNGKIKIIGRCTDLINVGGMKVFPSEVESVLMEIPQIIDCAVYSEKNSLIGEVVLAKVVTKDDLTNLEVKILVSEHCKGKLDKYKIPVKVFVVENLPYTARFKKQR